MAKEEHLAGVLPTTTGSASGTTQSLTSHTIRRRRILRGLQQATTFSTSLSGLVPLGIRFMLLLLIVIPPLAFWLAAAVPVPPLPFEFSKETSFLPIFVAANVSSLSSLSLEGVSAHQRPILYTYFEHENDDNANATAINGMRREDHEAILELWKESWTAAGWNPVVLNKRHARQHARYEDWDKLLKEISHADGFNRIVFHRWMAMSTLEQGGWMSDYDVFPMDPAFSINDQQFDAQNLPRLPQQLTLYEKVAPSLVAGTASAWQEITRALMEQVRDMVHEHRDSNSTRSGLYWTDTLGLLQLWRQKRIRVESRVVSLERAAVAIHKGVGELNCTSPTTKGQNHHHRAVRNKWAVHVSPRSIVTLSAPPMTTDASSFSKLRLPRHRATIARQWLESLGVGGVERTRRLVCSTSETM